MPQLPEKGSFLTILRLRFPQGGGHDPHRRFTEAFSTAAQAMCSEGLKNLSFAQQRHTGEPSWGQRKCESSPEVLNKRLHQGASVAGLGDSLQEPGAGDWVPTPQLFSGACARGWLQRV